MGLTRKDAAASLLTAFIVLVFFSVHEGWGVPLVGDSVRWATGVILLAGVASCSLGSPSEGTGAWWLGAIGGLALVFGVVALVTGSLTALSLLVTADVVLWAAATARHALAVPHRHAPA